MSEGQLSILMELQEEIEALRKEKEELVEKLRTLESFNQLSFEIDKKARKISFILLASGIWNGKYYPLEVVKNWQHEGEGKPIYIEHGRTEMGKVKVGTTLKPVWDDILNCWKQEGLIENEEIWQEILEGKWRAVSPAFHTEWKIDGKVPRVERIYPLEEVSLTETPACKSCVITYHEGLSEKKDLSNEKGILCSGDSLMDEKVETKPEEIQEEKKVISIPLEKVELKEGDLVALIKTHPEELEEMARKKKIIYYYYYYPYPYTYTYPYPYPYPYPEKEEKEEKSEKEMSEKLSELEERISKLEEMIKGLIKKEEASEETTEEISEEKKEEEMKEEVKTEMKEEETKEEMTEKKEETKEETKETKEEMKEEKKSELEDLDAGEAFLLLLTKGKKFIS